MARNALFFLALSLALLLVPLTVHAQVVDCTGLDPTAYPSIASALAVATLNSPTACATSSIGIS